MPSDVEKNNAKARNVRDTGNEKKKTGNIHSHVVLSALVEHNTAQVFTYIAIANVTFYILIVECIREDLVPAPEHEINKLEHKAKREHEKAKKTGLSGALCNLADQINDKKDRPDKEKFEVLSTSVLNIARQGAVSIEHAQHAKQAYHTGRNVSECVIK